MSAAWEEVAGRDLSPVTPLLVIGLQVGTIYCSLYACSLRDYMHWEMSLLCDRLH